VTTTFLRHSKVDLALHTLRDGEGPALLRLHGLSERTPDALPPELAAWPGSVYGLDFTGHGASSRPRGGGYTAELLMADADASLRHLESATVVGRGLGAYVALLLAGARPRRVRGAILCDGPGLAGGGSRPTTPFIAPALAHEQSTPDPWASIELSTDLRPPDYATAFVRQATHLSGLETPLRVVARERPEWLEAILEDPGVAGGSLAEGLAAYARPAPDSGEAPA